jgi:hypothetical protein
LPDAQTLVAAGSSAHQLTRDFAALAGPAEVAIGLAAAYLGFDRFRYRSRVKQLAQALSKELSMPKDILKSSLLDGRITSDEKSLMTLFWFTENQSFRDELKSHVDKLKKTTFWNGLCFFLMRVLLRWRLDRRAVQVFLFLLCCWELHLAWVLYAASRPSWFMNQSWFGGLYFTLIAVTYAVPAISFVASESMMKMINDAASGWRESMLEQMKRSAESAKITQEGVPVAANEQVLINEVVAEVTDGR